MAEPWYTDCTVLPGVGDDEEEAVYDIGMASLGHNTAMMCYQVDLGTEGYVPKEKWFILSLTPDRTIDIQRIPGPPNPQGVYSMQLVRVGDAVVAYGGHTLNPIEAEREEYDDSIPRWFMAVYTIATGEWESVPYTEGDLSPEPLCWSCLFGIGNTLVVVGGNQHPPDVVSPMLTWEYSLDTRQWTRCMDCPRAMSSKTSGATFHGTHHIYSDAHLAYKDRKWTKTPIDMGDPTVRTLLAVPLYGHNQLMAVTKWCRKTSKGVQRFYLCDPVSNEPRPLPPLPLSARQLRYLVQSKTVMLSPTTMLSVATDTSVLVEIDPALLGPEYH
ncbi:hypothetical protein KIPB_006065 [Kipferlia bialata]|uniref:Uncharacterized protein n=1 Tax=Kipferlia bialata TaxID=797122 RepID=A0A9K3GJJ3_9EUKA|nr:hypothetical protein KIPB_006065 [Kipferlia bialata]|eukprot:g6065.t1